MTNNANAVCEAIIQFATLLPDTERDDLDFRIHMYQGKSFSWDHETRDIATTIKSAIEPTDERDEMVGAFGRIVAIIAIIDHIYFGLTSEYSNNKQWLPS